MRLDDHFGRGSTLQRNERVKLAASFWNNVGAGMVIVGMAGAFFLDKPPGAWAKIGIAIGGLVLGSMRKGPFSTAGFARMLERAGTAAGLAFQAHPHMLRHACGFTLANKGTDTRTLQAYLGHKNIQHTVRYTELSPTRFKDLWR